MMDERDERTKFVAGLRALADWMEAYPDTPMPVVSQFNAFVDSRDEMAALARRMGDARKLFLDDWFCLVKDFGGAVELHFNLPRQEACVRRVVGVREIPARTEEIVEWDCHPLLTERLA